MPGRRRTAVEGEQRRAQIIEAAEHAIATTGFEGLRVRDVADQVGINIATLHYHFPTKEALVAAVVQRIVSTLDRVPLSDPVQDPRQMLVDHVEHILGRFGADRNLFVVLNETYARADRDAELRAVLLANDHAWAEYLRTIFAAGRDAGQFRTDLDPDGATVLVIGFLKSLLTQLDLTAERRRLAADEIIRAVTAP
ncbi:TetR/AcrR family transcriptional regulator [Actinophytocola oryzae]|uniref:TetR family transcriptional regulator n=1 Tax=Actinophytocola oryzae TaxID=502181 RepID=A0A4V3FUS3_9PSEU|nr:TetR/AcrR family transcriptional regulator [Actinophytocola oryzae]TDV56321.1 TetR family transcriptional regulator [Actinophytocola oryzae]